MPPVKRILLVDPGVKESDQISRGLGQAGYLLIIAEDGAVAINKALMDPPDMIITAADMPMVDGFKLCQLLRTNPATRHIPFIFVTDKETNPKKLGQFIRPDDDFILRPFKMEELLGRVHNLFYRMDKVMEVSQEVDRSVGGTLTEIALVDLLQIFKMNRKNGILTLKAEGQTGVVQLREGMVINAQLGKVSGEKAIFRLITWQHGTFEFKPALVEAEVKIHMPTENLVMEGLRQLDELNHLTGKLPARKDVLRVRKTFTGPETKLKPITAEILRLLEYFQRVEDILDNSSFSDLEVLATLQSLLERDIIEIGGGETRGTSAGPTPLLSLEEALKIGYFLGVGRGEPNQKWLGKILLFAQHGELLDSFLEKGINIPEFKAERAPAPPAGSEICSIGVTAAVAIMDNITLLLFHLPPLEGCEPLWRTFHHRAVGALLLGGDGTGGERVLGSMAAFLREMKIPLAAVRPGAAAAGEEAAAGPPDAAADGAAASGIPWKTLDPSRPDFTRRALRCLFEAILAT